MKNYLKTFMNRESLRQFLRLGMVGGMNTVVDFGIFNVLLLLLPDERWEPSVAVTISYIAATAFSYVLNRRWTFELDGTWGSSRETGAFYVVNTIALAATLAIVEGAQVLWGPLTVLQLNIAKFAAVILILFPKYAGYRDLVFRRSIEKDLRN
ncbi:MAG TPA: GtrA family protein [Acidimicrobiia bacterium]|nr:GtrA family protein [Acidimicrobiia bacterium]